MNKTLKYIKDFFGVNINEIQPGSEIGGVNRTIMAQILSNLGFNNGVEIGVAEGYHAKVLLDQNPKLKLSCVDIWSKYPGYEEYQDPDDVFQKALTILNPYGVNFYRQFSMDALEHFPDKSLDFVYLDSAHDFKNIAMDIYEWSKKVKPEGIVFGHDFKNHNSYYDKGRHRYPVHVKSVVTAYMEAFEIRNWFVLKNDISDPTFGRDNPGWLFIRDEGDKLWS